MNTKVIETKEETILAEAFADPEMLDTTAQSNSNSQVMLHRCC